MRVKSMLLASSALSTIVMAAPAEAGGLYVSLFGGANWLGSAGANNTFSSVTTSSSTNFTHITGAAAFVDDRKGFVVGGAVGVGLDSWLRGLRGEVEMSYRRNKLEGYWATASITLEEGVLDALTGAEGPINGHSSTFAMLANVWYDINLGIKATPYVGGGIGWARTNVSLSRIATFGSTPDIYFNDEKSGFAYQLGAGFNYEVMPDVKIGLGYRYFRGPRPDTFFFGGKRVDAIAPLKVENENQSVSLSLTVGIN